MSRGWEADGFEVAHDVLSADDIARLLNVVSRHYDEIVCKSGLRGDDEAFHRKLIELRASDRTRFSAIYDRLQTNAVVQRIALGSKIAEVAGRLLGTTTEALSASGVIFRMDCPNDTRNNLDWHQDQAYMPVNQDGMHGLVVWMPLQDTDKRMGAIRVKPRSHAAGFIKPSSSNSNEIGISEQHRVSGEEFEEAVVEVRAGDGLFFPMTLVHASGFNQSDRIRFTLGVRYHRSLVADFSPFRFDRVLTRVAS